MKRSAALAEPAAPAFAAASMPIAAAVGRERSAAVQTARQSQRGCYNKTAWMAVSVAWHRPHREVTKFLVSDRMLLRCERIFASPCCSCCLVRSSLMLAPIRMLGAMRLLPASCTTWTLASGVPPAAGSGKASGPDSLHSRCLIHLMTVKRSDASMQCRFFASQQLVRKLAVQGGSYNRALRTLLQQAQATGSAGLLCNPFVQMSTMMRLQLLDIPAAFADAQQLRADAQG